MEAIANIHVIKEIQSQNYTAITTSNFLLLKLSLSGYSSTARLHPQNLGPDAFKISQSNLILIRAFM